MTELKKSRAYVSFTPEALELGAITKRHVMGESGLGYCRRCGVKYA